MTSKFNLYVHPIMTRKIQSCALIAWLCALMGTGVASEPKSIASKPPLGWNSFDSYGVYLHEKAAMENLEAMAKHLGPYGYEYYVIDNGWFGEYKLKPGTLYPIEKHAGDVRINEHGHVIPSQSYFSGGLKPIIDRCHELGLKFGIHMMRGIPRKAYEMNVSIKDTSYRARDIADTNPKNNCTWCTYNYAVDMSKPGSQEWYDGLIQHLSDMGVDMIKYDDIVPFPAEVEAVAKAIKKTGKPILLSLSPGGDVPPEAIQSFRMAQMLRVTKDVWDHAHYLDECFDAWKKWTGRESANFWIDMDMIPFGQLLMMSPKKEMTGESDENTVRLAGNGYRRWQQYSQDQMFTFISLRALSASPLMVGGDLPTMDGFSLRLLTDPDMLACNQNGVMGKLVSENGGIEVWSTPERGGRGRGWVGVFNRSNRLKTVTLTQAFLGIEADATLYDVWKGRKEHKLSSKSAIEIDIHADGVLFLRYE
jgi:alpha-galactosidase